MTALWVLLGLVALLLVLALMPVGAAVAYDGAFRVRVQAGFLRFLRTRRGKIIYKEKSRAYRRFLPAPAPVSKISARAYSGRREKSRGGSPGAETP